MKNLICLDNEKTLFHAFVWQEGNMLSSITRNCVSDTLQMTNDENRYV